MATKVCFFKSLKSMSLTWKNEQIERFIVSEREVVSDFFFKRNDTQIKLTRKKIRIVIQRK